MPRFFLENINEDRPCITGGDAVHIGRSLRMKTGDKLTVCAGSTDYECAIKSIDKDTVYLEILDREICGSEPNVKVTLFQAMPKLSKLEHIIQKSVELGVTEIVPVLTRRCVSRPDEREFRKKLERLNKISLEAAKQSGRGIVPEVAMITDFKGAVEQMRQSDCPVMLYEEGGIRFNELDVQNARSLSLLVGSEGGFDPEEAKLAADAGINAVWLGKRILRCETAPVAALSILMYITKNL